MISTGEISLQGNEKQKTKVAVIGGGLAGLISAYRLIQMGFDVELYEARERLGGRIFTIKLGNHPAELGGQNILNGGNCENILSLIKEMNLEVESGKTLLHLHYFDGEAMIEPKILLKNYNFTPEQLEEKLAEISKNAKTMLDVLNALFPQNEILIKAFSTMLSVYEGLPPDRLSLDAIETLYHMVLGGLSVAHQNSGDDEVYVEHLWVKGGNARLIEKLAEKISTSRIHLNSPLKSVKKESTNSTLLTFKNGKKISANIVVFAFPCTVYEDINFEDDLIPTQKLADIISIQYGANSKILIPVDGANKADGTFINGRLITFFPGEFHTACLYYINDYALFDDATIKDTFRRDLPLSQYAYSFSPDLNPPVMAMDRTDEFYSGPVGYSWPNDPYAKGSYSCITADQAQVFTNIQTIGSEKVKTLFAPIENKIFFSGEHTSILLEVDGTMEAAVESGERTARLIQQAYC